MCPFCIHFSCKCILQNAYFINVHKVYNVMHTSMFEFAYILCNTFLKGVAPKSDLKTCFSQRLIAILSIYAIRLVAHRDSELKVSTQI